jgi:hypothetical protein
MSTQIVVSEFIALIDNEKEYSLVEIKKILGDVYKNAYKKETKEKKTKAKKSSDDEENPKEKKPPSAYNIFVKENMGTVKEQFPEMNNQERMSKIGELWSIKKAENKVIEEVTEEVVAKEEEVAEEVAEEVVEEVVDVVRTGKAPRRALANKQKVKKEKAGEKADEGEDI